jgi:hypothetical protein
MGSTRHSARPTRPMGTKLVVGVSVPWGLGYIGVPSFGSAAQGGASSEAYAALWRSGVFTHSISDQGVAEIKVVGILRFSIAISVPSFGSSAKSQ